MQFHHRRLKGQVPGVSVWHPLGRRKTGASLKHTRLRWKPLTSVGGDNSLTTSPGWVCKFQALFVSRVEASVRILMLFC